VVRSLQGHTCRLTLKLLKLPKAAYTKRKKLGGGKHADKTSRKRFRSGTLSREKRRAAPVIQGNEQEGITRVTTCF